MNTQITRVTIIDLPTRSDKNNEAARVKVGYELNHNSVMFNITDRCSTNLLNYDSRVIFKKTPQEKEALKIAKKLYKASRKGQ